MKCPYCGENFNASTETEYLFSDQRNHQVGDYQYATVTTICANDRCKKPIIFLKTVYFPDNTGLPPGFASTPSSSERMVLPRTSSRLNVVVSDIPEQYVSDYDEACMVLADSPKASAALSRRLLQSLLRDELGVEHDNLSNEIGQVIDSQDLPSRLLGKLDAVREIGNFAAHPMKSTNSGEIVDVEPGEADLNLEVIESIFDYLFTAPRLEKERMASINEKLVAAGKQTLEDTIKKRADRLKNASQKKQ